MILTQFDLEQMLEKMKSMDCNYCEVNMGMGDDGPIYFDAMDENHEYIDTILILE